MFDILDVFGPCSFIIIITHPQDVIPDVSECSACGPDQDKSYKEMRDSRRKAYEVSKTGDDVDFIWS